MTNCISFYDDLVDSLTQNPSSLLTNHLDSCATCFDERNRLLLVQNLYQSLPEREVPEILTAKVLAMVNQRKSFASWGLWLDRMIERLPVLSFRLAPLGVFAFFVTAVGLSFQNPSIVATNDLSNPTISIVESPALVPSVAHQGASPSALSGDFQNVSVEMNVPADVSVSSRTSFSDLERNYAQRRQALFESDADTLLMRGRRYKTLGKTDLALKDFETIYHFYPNYTYMSDVLLYKAQCYVFLGQINDAMESLRILQNRDPSRAALAQSMMEQMQQIKK